MTTRYRVEYALKSHRRDQLIEWIKGLLAVPFVLHSHPTAVYHEHSSRLLLSAAADTHQRYGEIMRDVERLILDHSTSCPCPPVPLHLHPTLDRRADKTVHHEQTHAPGKSKLKNLVPSVGSFFTKLPLQDAFDYQDAHRFISRRRFVAPSFNDIRLILNTAQVLGLLRSSGLDLVTFDGDVTLYDDGACLMDDNPVIPRLLRLLEQGCKVGIVTAAGYSDAPPYYTRLKGLLDAVHNCPGLSAVQKAGLVVMGGESNFLFRYDPASLVRLTYVPRDEWILDDMRSWNEGDISALLDIAESSLRACAQNLNMPVAVLRKDRAVGVYPLDKKRPIDREQLEETVLVVQNTVERSPVGARLPFCAFNGGNDVFVDIGDKSWGVRACQQYFGGIDRTKTLHIGDQFLSAGANDFKARLASTTAWIASPAETVALLDEIEGHEKGERIRDGCVDC